MAMNEDDVTRQITESLEKAVRNELEKKAKLGQDAIIARDGKPVRVKASELIKDDE
jgi:hypothetical protein